MQAEGEMTPWRDATPCVSQSGRSDNRITWTGRDTHKDHQVLWLVPQQHLLHEDTDLGHPRVLGRTGPGLGCVCIMQAKTWSLASCQLAWLFSSRGPIAQGGQRSHRTAVGAGPPALPHGGGEAEEGPGFASRHARADPLEGSRFPEKSRISPSNICACGSSQPPACEGLPGPWVAVVGLLTPSSGT